MKECIWCKVKKEYSEFNKNSRASDGYISYCKQCGKERYGPNYGKHTREYYKNLKENNPLKFEERRWRSRERDWKSAGINITKDEYLHKLQEQNGLCAICEKLPENNKFLCVDHDHLTGRIRGLLCKPCNLLIGCCNDNINTLSRAISYLKKNS